MKREPDPQEIAEAEGRPLIAWTEPTVYDVFEPDGTYVGQVSIPDGVWVVATAGDTVWAVTHDEFDIPYVHRYRIAWI